MATFLQAFAEQVALRGDTLALADGDLALTYAELDRAANRMANAILARVGPVDEQVAVLLGHRAEAILALLGVTKAGKVQVPLDGNAPPARTRRILEHSQARLLVTDRSHALPSSPVDVLLVDEFRDGASDENPDLDRAPEALIALYYTSGSTGEPKGVAVGYGETVAKAQSGHAAVVGTGDRFALVGSLAFGGARAYQEVFLNGASVHLYDLQRHGPTRLAEWLERERITSFRTLTSVLRSLLDTLPEGRNLPDLRVTSAGGEPLYRHDAERFWARVGTHSELQHNYSTTEARVTTRRIVEPGVSLPDGPLHVGAPLPHVRLELLEVDAEGVGEIVVSSPYVARGYWRNPELTAARFTVSADGAIRSFRTGDLGRWRDDGMLELVGRGDARVKVRGYTVDLGEVEAALAAVPTVDRAAVTTAPRGEGLRLVAHLVPAHGARPTVNALRRSLESALPPYMIPASFVLAGSLPQTTTGKVDRRALPPPSTARPALETPFEAPHDELERTIAGVWEEHLEVSPIGVDDDFYALGGDSLAVAESTVRLNELLDDDLPFVLYEEDSATVALLAARIRDRHSALFSGAAPLQPDGPGTPFFCVGGGGGEVYELRALARALGADRPFYALQPAGAKADRLRRDVRRLAAHHLEELLRIQPDGPHLLGGYSSGGLVALELAQQLTARGSQPAALVLFDSPPPGAPDFASQHRLQHGLEVRMKKRLLRVLLDLHVLVGRPVPQQWRELHRMDVSGRARRRYRARPYSGPVVLLRAEAHRSNSPPDHGWSALTSDVRVVQVPGDHQTMLRPPNVEATAERLRAVLRAAGEPEARIPERHAVVSR